MPAQGWASLAPTWPPPNPTANPGRPSHSWRTCGRTRTRGCPFPHQSSRRPSASSPTASRCGGLEGQWGVHSSENAAGAASGSSHERPRPGTDACQGLWRQHPTPLPPPLSPTEKLWQARGVGAGQGLRLVDAPAAQAGQAGAPAWVPAGDGPRAACPAHAGMLHASLHRRPLACTQVDVDGNPWPLDTNGNPILK